MSFMSSSSTRFALRFATLVAAVTLSASPIAMARDDGREDRHDHGHENGHDEDRGDSRIQQGFKIAPVHLNLHGKNRALVGLGSYIVNAVGGCNDCHTQPAYEKGGDPFLGQQKRVNAAGYLAGGRIFFGPIISRNITPEKSGLPAGLTREEFVKLIRTGIDPDAAHPQFGPYLQVMPWPVYQDMTDRDLHAVYEYLRSIPCVEGDPGAPTPTGPRC